MLKLNVIYLRKGSEIILANFIIPAIITLIISITSGLMLDYYKNLAPKILCNVRNDIPIEMNSKKKCVYTITVNNPSNKTIHELTLNIQGSQTNLKSTSATITKGLKFDSSIKDNILEVYIPFLSKGDKFSVTVYVENQYEVDNKPVIVIRSPENFNQIDSVEQKGNQSLWFIITKNIKQVIVKAMQKFKAISPNIKNDFTTVMSKATIVEQITNKKDRQVSSKNKKLSMNKKVMIITVSIILVMVAGVFGKFYSKGTSTNQTTPTVKTIVPKQSTDANGTTGAAGSTTGVTGVKGSKEKATETTGVTGSKRETTGVTGVKGSTGETTGVTGEKESTGGTTGVNGAKGSTGAATGTTGSTGTATGTKDSTGTATGTTGTTGAATGTTGSTGAATGTTGSTGTATGTTGSTGAATGTTGK